MFRNIFALFALIAIGSMVLPSNASAQFGQNKVQYRDFDWKFIESQNFDVYYTDGSKYLAEFSAVAAEKALLSIQSTLNYKLTMRLALIVYDSHNEFQQTNVTGSYMPEGVGGFTELFKNRVVVPFQGSYTQLRHVIHHELVHGVLNDMFYGGTLQSALTASNGFMIPLWVNEGLAEFESLGGMNTETDMFMRDLTISEYLPPLERLGGYLAYRGGQTFYWYVADKFGKAKVTDFINKLSIYKNLDLTFQATFNMNLEDFSEMWERDIKKIYWPDLTVYDDPKDFAMKLTDRRKIGNFYNTSPAISPDGERMAFISDRDDGLFGIFVQELDSKKPPEKLISSARQQDFEDLNILTPGISWDPTGKKIAISAKSGGQDAVFITDAKSGDYEKLLFELNSISSVTWSPDGKSLAFLATQKEQADIYIYEFAQKKLTKATDDVFSETQIAWSPDSKSIFFVSDRKDETVFSLKAGDYKMWKHDFEASDIFKVNIGEQRITRITADPEFRKTSLAVAADGNRVLYVSNKSGIGNVYVRDIKNGTDKPLTNSLSGIAQLSITPDNSKMLFAAQVQGGYDIFLFRLPLEKSIDKEPVPTAFRNKQKQQQEIIDKIVTETPEVKDEKPIGYGEFDVDFSDQQLVEPNPDVMKNVSTDLEIAVKGQEIESAEFVEKDYQVTFTPDIILVNPNFSTYYGFQSMTQMLFSDIMGNHQIYAGINLLTDLKNSQFMVAYNYLPEIIDYQISVHHSSLNFWGNNSQIFNFRNYGTSLLASYPFDLFTRVEWGIDLLAATMEHKAYINEPQLPTKERYLMLPQGRFVFDNTLDGWYGPNRGMRSYIEFIGSPKFGNNTIGFMTVKTDIRQYFPISDYISIAMRGSAGASFGPNPQKFYMGGVENIIFMTRDNYKGREMPFENPEDYLFLQNFVMPMRGWLIAELTGNKFFVANAELRFPLFTALVAGPVPILLQGVMGSLFADVGGAWNDKFVISEIDKLDKDHRKAVNMISSTGIGVRSYLMGLPVKMDVAWRYEYWNWSKPQYLFSIGYDF